MSAPNGICPPLVMIAWLRMRAVVYSPTAPDAHFVYNRGTVATGAHRPCARGGAMEQRPLGKSGVLVPVLGMGTWRTFDVQSPDADNARRDLVSSALAAGVTVYDS